MASAKERSVLTSFGSIIREDPVLTEINRMLSCIKEANYSTIESTAEEAGYSGDESERGTKPVAIHVVEYIPVEKPAFMGLIIRQVQERRPICLLQFENSLWKIPEKDIHNTEKLSGLYRHLKYYNLKIQLDCTSEEILNKLYIETRESRPGAIDSPSKPDADD